MSALHSTPIVSPGTTGQHRQHCTDTDPERRKDKCISIDADRRVWKCHRCDVGGSLDQPHQLSESERQRLQDKRSKAEKRQAAEKQQAALRLRRAWDRFSETGSSEYLTRKGLDHIPGTRYGRDKYGPFMAMPLRGPGGDFRGYHRHYTNAKKIAYGTDKRGAYFLLPGTGPVVVCEGLTTGYSVALATGYPVAVAVDRGNIGPVVASLKAINPQQRIIIGADNDAFKEENYGLVSAYAAAHQHHVEIAAPDFTGLDTSGKPTDFDDVRQLAGLAEVARQIDQACTPAELFCKQTVAEIQQSRPRLIAVRASQGVGKTERIIKPILATVQRALAITHRRSLATDTANRLNLENYQNIADRTDAAARGEKLIVCVNSLVTGRLQTAPAMQAPQIIAIDETEQVLDHLGEAKHFKDTAGKTTERFWQAIQSAEQVILADADLDEDTVAKFEQKIGCKATWFVFEPPAPELEIEVIEYPQFITQIQHTLRQGNVFIAADSLNVLNEVKQLSDDLLLVTSETAKTKSAKAFLDDPNATVPSIRHLGVSPTCGTGVSITTPHFTHHYVVWSGTLTPTELNQIMRRDRTAKKITVVLRNLRGRKVQPLTATELVKRYHAAERAEYNDASGLLVLTEFDHLRIARQLKKHRAMLAPGKSAWRDPKAAMLALFAKRGFTVHENKEIAHDKAGALLLKQRNEAAKLAAVQNAAPLDHDAAAAIERAAKTPETAAQLERYRLTEAFRLAPDAEITEDLFKLWADGRGLEKLMLADNVLGDMAAVEARSRREKPLATTLRHYPKEQRRYVRQLLSLLNINADTGEGEYTQVDALAAWQALRRSGAPPKLNGLDVPDKAPKHPTQWAADQLKRIGLKTESRRPRSAPGRVYRIEPDSWQFMQAVVQRRQNSASAASEVIHPAVVYINNHRIGWSSGVAA